MLPVTEFDHLILMIVSGYLLVGYLVHWWVQRMVTRRWREEYSDDERAQIDHTVSLVSVMLLWPKIVVPPLAWFLWNLFLGIIAITLRYLIGRFKRK